MIKMPRARFSEEEIQILYQLTLDKLLQMDGVEIPRFKKPDPIEIGTRDLCRVIYHLERILHKKTGRVGDRYPPVMLNGKPVYTYKWY